MSSAFENAKRQMDEVSILLAKDYSDLLFADQGHQKRVDRQSEKTECHIFDLIYN